MAYGNYLVVAEPPTLKRLAARVRTKVGKRGGDALVPVGANRALLVPVAAERLARGDPRSSVPKLLSRWGAERVESVAPEQAAALLSLREPAEATLERMAEGDGLVEGGHDWHVAATRLHRAWAQVGGPGNIDWDGIQAGQIDTGYTQSPALGWKNGASAVVNTRDDRNFYTPELAGDPDPFVSGNSDPLSAYDPYTGPHGGHGTRTASVLAGFDESEAGRARPGGRKLAGYYGAAPKLPHVPIRLSNSVMIDDMTVELGDALEHLLLDVRCQVITLSMGASPLFPLPQKTREMIDLAYERGVIVCCAAGNYVGFVVAPARGPRTIAVAGSAPGGVPWTGSSCGRYVDIAAPAWPVRRANVTADGMPEYGYGDGTSYATPQVAGTAALWLARHRGVLAARYPEGWQRVAAFLHLLKKHARAGRDWDPTRYGPGILDADAVLAAPLPPAGRLARDAEPHVMDYAAAETPVG